MKRLLFFIFMTAGCATTGKFEEMLQRNVGRNINDVIKDSGIPQRTYMMSNGQTAYEYSYQGPVKVNGPMFQMGNPSMASNNYTISQKSCTWTFFTRSDVIESWFHQGNACKAH